MSTQLPDACRACDEQLVALAFGETGDVPPSVREHLAGCSRCQGALKELETTRRVMSALPLEEPSAEMDARVLGALDAYLAGADVSRHLRLPEPGVDAPAPRLLSIAPAAAEAAGSAPAAKPSLTPAASLPTPIRARRRWPTGQLAAAASIAILAGGAWMLSEGGNFATHKSEQVAAPAPVAKVEKPSNLKDFGRVDDEGPNTVAAPEQAAAALRTQEEADAAERAAALEASRREAEAMFQRAAELAPEGATRDVLAGAGGPAGEAAPPAPDPAPTAAMDQKKGDAAADEEREARPDSMQKVAVARPPAEEPAPPPVAVVVPPPEPAPVPQPSKVARSAPATTEGVAARLRPAEAAPTAPAPAPAAVAPKAAAAPLAKLVTAVPVAPVPVEAPAAAPAPAAPAAKPSPFKSLASADADGFAVGALRDEASGAEKKKAEGPAEDPWVPLQRQLADAKARGDWKTVAAVGNKLSLMGKAPEAVKREALAERVRALAALGDVRGAKASAQELKRRWGLPADLAQYE